MKEIFMEGIPWIKRTFFCTIRHDFALCWPSLIKLSAQGLFSDLLSAVVLPDDMFSMSHESLTPQTNWERFNVEISESSSWRHEDTEQESKNNVRFPQNLWTSFMTLVVRFKCGRTVSCGSLKFYFQTCGRWTINISVALESDFNV